MESSRDDNGAVVEIESVRFPDDGDPVSTASLFIVLSTEDDEDEEVLLPLPLPSH